MARIGIRVQDLFDVDVLRAKVSGALNLKNQILVKIYNRKAVEVEAVVAELRGYAERLAPMVADTSLMLDRMLDEGKTIVLEAGQATLLDVDHGTYPFVTSSNATAGGACTGSGIPPTRISGVIAVARARSRPSCWTRTASGCCGSAPNTARRPGGRAGAAGSTR
jgi:adenylosuccinate synthase